MNYRVLEKLSPPMLQITSFLFYTNINKFLKFFKFAFKINYRKIEIYPKISCLKIHFFRIIKKKIIVKLEVKMYRDWTDQYL